MARASSKEKNRDIYEWEKKEANIGVTSTLPYNILTEYINSKGIVEIIRKFFENSTKEIHLLDLCILEQLWWMDETIIAARYSKIEHPQHYSGEYIFDNENGERTIIEIRQPDLDGKHWKASHVHIKRGTIDCSANHTINQINYNEHIAISPGKIDGVFIKKISEDERNKEIPKI